MRERIAAVGLGLAVLGGCGQSRSALTSCSVDAGAAGGATDPCVAPLVCMTYLAEGPDGLCHGVIGQVCALPCQSNADCAVLGKNSVCYACPSMPGVCTAFQ